FFHIGIIVFQVGAVAADFPQTQHAQCCTEHIAEQGNKVHIVRRDQQIIFFLDGFFGSKIQAVIKQQLMHEIQREGDQVNQIPRGQAVIFIHERTRVPQQQRPLEPVTEAKNIKQVGRPPQRNRTEFRSKTDENIQRNCYLLQQEQSQQGVGQAAFAASSQQQDGKKNTLVSRHQQHDILSIEDCCFHGPTINRNARASINARRLLLVPRPR